jgi:hypothetical protein
MSDRCWQYISILNLIDMGFSYDEAKRNIAMAEREFEDMESQGTLEGNLEAASEYLDRLLEKGDD